MQYSDFVRLYPVLNAHLINLAVERIARTPKYLEANVRSRIAEVNHRISRVACGILPPDTSVLKDPFFDYCRKNVEEFRQLECDRDELLSQLVAAKKAPLVTPSLEHWVAASAQVKDYIQQLLLQGSTEALLKWNGVLSGEEKHLICNGHSFYKTRAKELDQWWYCDDRQCRALWEPVIETIRIEDEEIAYVTENSYGVKCLNSLQTMFVDIDIDKEAEDMSWRSMPFGKKEWNETLTWEVIKSVTEQNKELSFAVYRTRNGFRLIEMANEWSAKSTESKAVLSALGSDRLFTSLCQHQGTFRARLEVKPWREDKSIRQTVCRFMGMMGHSKNVTDSAAKIKQVHDRWCLTKGELA